MQSHGGQVRHLADIPRWCDDVTDSASPTRFARRSLLRAAVLGRRDESDFSLIITDNSDADGADRSLKYTVTGRILDISPHILVLHTDRGEQRFPIAASAEAWRGGPVSPAAPLPLSFRCCVPFREIRLCDVDGVGDFLGVPGSSFGGGPAGCPLASGPVPGEGEDGGVQAGQRGIRAGGAVPAVRAAGVRGDVGPDEAEDGGERDEAGVEPG